MAGEKRTSFKSYAYVELKQNDLDPFRFATSHWLRSVLFYLTFYTILGGLTAAMLGLYMWRIVDLDRPSLTGVHSALKNEPGLSIVPIVDTRNTFIVYNNGRRETYVQYQDVLMAFMQHYEDTSTLQDTLRDCEFSNKTGIPPDVDLKASSCVFDANWAYRCNVNRNFGYDDYSPCFILTLNRVYGWLPQSEDGVQVCCEGATPNDDELLGTMCLYDALVHDEGGCNRRCGRFRHQYYPFLNQESYQSPLVFLEVRYPRKNVLIRIQCQLVNLPNRAKIEFALLID